MQTLIKIIITLKSHASHNILLFKIEELFVIINLINFKFKLRFYYAIVISLIFLNLQQLLKLIS